MKSIKDLPLTKPRESDVSLIDIRTRISGIKDCGNYFNESTRYNAEVFLCLANEIAELKAEIIKLKNK